ncbi:MAG: hypothetical protein NT157_06735, partial [Candidatus Micrarchaeota archaeon]|nr:hypothetical protein [Candidatus Micrarchaeota archaeon]
MSQNVSAEKNAADKKSEVSRILRDLAPAQRTESPQYKANLAKLNSMSEDEINKFVDGDVRIAVRIKALNLVFDSHQPMSPLGEKMLLARVLELHPEYKAEGFDEKIGTMATTPKPVPKEKLEEVSERFAKSLMTVQLPLTNAIYVGPSGVSGVLVTVDFFKEVYPDKKIELKPGKFLELTPEEFYDLLVTWAPKAIKQHHLDLEDQNIAGNLTSIFKLGKNIADLKTVVYKKDDKAIADLIRHVNDQYKEDLRKTGTAPPKPEEIPQPEIPIIAAEAVQEAKPEAKPKADETKTTKKEPEIPVAKPVEKKREREGLLLKDGSEVFKFENLGLAPLPNLDPDRVTFVLSSQKVIFGMMSPSSLDLSDSGQYLKGEKDPQWGVYKETSASVRLYLEQKKKLEEDIQNFRAAPEGKRESGKYKEIVNTWTALSIQAEVLMATQQAIGFSRIILKYLGNKVEDDPKKIKETEQREAIREFLKNPELAAIDKWVKGKLGQVALAQADGMKEPERTKAKETIARLDGMVRLKGELYGILAKCLEIWDRKGKGQAGENEISDIRGQIQKIKTSIDQQEPDSPGKYGIVKGSPFHQSLADLLDELMLAINDTKLDDTLGNIGQSLGKHIGIDYPLTVSSTYQYRPGYVLGKDREPTYTSARDRENLQLSLVGGTPTHKGGLATFKLTQREAGVSNQYHAAGTFLKDSNEGSLKTFAGFEATGTKEMKMIEPSHMGKGDALSLLYGGFKGQKWEGSWTYKGLGFSSKPNVRPGHTLELGYSGKFDDWNAAVNHDLNTGTSAGKLDWRHLGQISSSDKENKFIELLSAYNPAEEGEYFGALQQYFKGDEKSLSRLLKSYGILKAIYLNEEGIRDRLIEELRVENKEAFIEHLKETLYGDKKKNIVGATEIRQKRLAEKQFEGGQSSIAAMEETSLASDHRQKFSDEIINNLLDKRTQIEAIESQRKALREDLKPPEIKPPEIETPIDVTNPRSIAALRYKKYAEYSKSFEDLVKKYREEATPGQELPSNSQFYVEVRSLMDQLYLQARAMADPNNPQAKAYDPQLIEFFFLSTNYDFSRSSKLRKEALEFKDVHPDYGLEASYGPASEDPKSLKVYTMADLVFKYTKLTNDFFNLGIEEKYLLHDNDHGMFTAVPVTKVTTPNGTKTIMRQSDLSEKEQADTPFFSTGILAIPATEADQDPLASIFSSEAAGVTLVSTESQEWVDLTGKQDVPVKRNWPGLYRILKENAPLPSTGKPADKAYIDYINSQLWQIVGTDGSYDGGSITDYSEYDSYWVQYLVGLVPFSPEARAYTSSVNEAKSVIAMKAIDDFEEYARTSKKPLRESEVKNGKDSEGNALFTGFDQVFSILSNCDPMTQQTFIKEMRERLPAFNISAELKDGYFKKGLDNLERAAQDQISAENAAMLKGTFGRGAPSEWITHADYAETPQNLRVGVLSINEYKYGVLKKIIEAGYRDMAPDKYDAYVRTVLKWTNAEAQASYNDLKKEGLEMREGAASLEKISGIEKKTTITGAGLYAAIAD